MALPRASVPSSCFLSHGCLQCFARSGKLPSVMVEALTPVTKVWKPTAMSEMVQVSPKVSCVGILLPNYEK